MISTVPSGIIIVSLILLNSFFSSIEIALVSLNQNKIDLEVKKGSKRALKIKKLKEKPNLFLSVIQIIIHILTFCQGFSLNHENHHYGIDILVVVSSIVLGELVPKRIALAFPLQTAYFFINIFNIICFLTKPFVFIFNQISNLILFILRIDTSVKKDIVNEDELRFLLTSSYKTGVINNSEKDMIQNVFDFDGTLVSDIMRHRTEIIAINSNISKKDIIEFISREKYTRFPVYEENLDKIIGIVHVKDIFKGLLEVDKQEKNSSNKEQNFDIKQFLRKPYFVIEFQNISELFKEMQLKQNHIAIVVDEYGGTSGIVTIEDVIEEILGEIEDEYDKKNNEILKISDKEYIIRGTTHLHETEEHLKADLPIEDYDTLSGFILGQLKRMPDKNEKIQICYNNWQFEGLKYDGLVINTVRITRIMVQ
ncbi:Hemolysins and related proteins containing CBS domains [Candidatus Phytoplasma rubi]|uniref:Hemolysins and related proteins containing CBS domains n=1 Tax=Candidatus Phytoplasma rubi TaxID=399025 RepID=A0ABY7BTE5_9MOLU|nr:hemolysin family protein [Candidatus Phytoplasma rubi]WAN63322.1 Hemolysins and related proteins containing CBS domains [Candidatus Phytoplasma rubi]